MHIALKVKLNRIRREFKEAIPKMAGLFAAALVCLFAVFLIGSGRTTFIEHALVEQWFSLRGQLPPPTGVTIVRLDNPAYKAANARTGDIFPRELLAKRLREISEHRPKMVLLDLIFDTTGDPTSEKKLAAALAGSPSVIGRYTQELQEVDTEGNRGRVRNIVMPTTYFSNAAKYVVPISVRTHKDVAMNISLSSGNLGVPLLEPLRNFTGGNLSQPSYRDLLNCYGPPGSIANLSFAELLDETKEVERKWFENRIVLIGLMNQAGVGVDKAKDTLKTACSGLPTFGVEIHGTIVANLLERSWKKRLSVDVETAGSAILLCILGFIILRMSAVKAVCLTVASSTVLLCLSYFAFIEWSYLLPVAFVSVVGLPILLLMRLSAIGVKYYRFQSQFHPTR